MKIFSGVETVIVIEIGNDWLKIVEGQVSPKSVTINDGCFLKLSEIKSPILEAIKDVLKDKKWDKQNRRENNLKKQNNRKTLCSKRS